MYININKMLTNYFIFLIYNLYIILYQIPFRTFIKISKIKIKISLIKIKYLVDKTLLVL